MVIRGKICNSIEYYPLGGGDKADWILKPFIEPSLKVFLFAE